MKRKTIVFASGNKGKIKEVSKILNNCNVVSYKDFGLDFDIEETGTTFYENALIKAKTVCEKINLPVLADDSGLCVEALNGEPGIYSARYSKEEDDEHNIALLLKNLEGVEDRKAKFVCCMVMYYPDGKTVSATGEMYGKILREKEGANGFGYDCVFYSDELKKSLGLASDEEKNGCSHRSKALRLLVENLK